MIELGFCVINLELIGLTIHSFIKSVVFLQKRSQIPDFVEVEAKKWTYSQMAKVHRNWRHHLKKVFVDDYPGRLSWEHNEPVKKAEWDRFMEKYNTPEWQVKS